LLKVALSTIKQTKNKQLNVRRLKQVINIWICTNLSIMFH
jgi:hypothetical protein